MFTALLDTCVLWPSLQRDFLLSLAVEGMYRPVWSAAILAELEYHEAAKLVSRRVPAPDAQALATHLIRQMRTAFDDSEVVGWEALEGSYHLPDPDDEHVVAAAVVAGAGAIVTDNLRHFPQENLPAGLEVLTGAQFAHATVSLDPDRALAAIATIARRSGRHGPARTVDDILSLLTSRSGMHDAVGLMGAAR